ncbi:MAG: ATP-grasp domain-containing protein [Spirochaetes bacterium]|nr:ATP-grasp domain-containing protein [Spirochaetota bacterium]
MRKRSIMILGAGLLQIPALRTAKQLNCRTLVVDGDPEAVGASEADVFEPIDLKDLDGLLKVAQKWQNLYGLDGVFTAGTDFSASVAYVAEALKLPGIPYQIAIDASNKARMRKRFYSCGVPSPSFLEIEGRDFNELPMEGLRFPLVVKPVDNMGARGVVRVESWEALKTQLQESLRYSRSGKVIVEEFIEGPEFSLDALVYKGKIQICGIADRHIRFAPYFVEVGHTIPSSAPIEVQEEVIETFKAGIRALRIDPGAAKGDIFYSPGKGGVIGEIAARLSGGYMSGWTYPYSSGVNLTEGALRIALGEEPGDRTPKQSCTAAERALISIPGRVLRIEGVEEARKISEVKEVFMRVRTGDSVVFPTNNVEKCGNVIAVAEERTRAVRAAEDAVASILIRLDPMNEDTEQFLFTPNWMDGRSCYPLDSSLLERLRSLRWDVVAERTMESTRIDRQRTSFSRVPNLPIPILSFQCVHALDNWIGWNYLTLPKLMERLRTMAEQWKRASWVGRWIPGALFWYVAFRGGLQGVVWMLDHCSGYSNLEALQEKVKEWACAVGF